MKKCVLYIVLFVLPFNVLGHDSNQAHFNVVQEENSIIIQAEFPWMIRNALLQFAPELRSISSQTAYDTAFFQYVKENLVLVDKNGRTLELLQVEVLKANGHSHQTNYSIKFKGTDFSKIKNSVLFNVNDNQTNFHKFIKNSIEINFETTNNQAVFKLSENTMDDEGRNFLWLLVLLSIPVIVIKRKSLYK